MVRTNNMELKEYLGNRFLIEHWDDGKIEEKFKEIINHLKIEL